MGGSGQNAADQRFDLLHRAYLLQRFHRVEAGTVRITTSLDVDLRELFVMPRVLVREDRDDTCPEPRLRGRLRELKQRMDQIAARAKGQQAAQDRLFDTYQRDGARLASGQDPAAEPIGGAALSVASIEVTRRTLKALAAQGDVMAVLPDQRVRQLLMRSGATMTLMQWVTMWRNTAVQRGRRALGNRIHPSASHHPPSRSRCCKSSARWRTRRS